MSIFSAETERLLSASGVALPHMALAPSLIGQCIEFAGQDKPLVVADENTWKAAGKRIAEEMSAAALVLENGVKPEMRQVQRIMEAAADLPVAVGSGTINDLCKYAAFLAKKPYVVFPTAPSMNGYASANASIIMEDGHKRSVQAALPRAIFCDLSVLRDAPLRLRQAGIGDSLARPTAQADWLLSHFLLDMSYDARPFTLLRSYEERLFASAAGIKSGEEQAVRALMEVLLLSGLGMTLSGGSYPASQGEHMIAQTYEALYPNATPVFHGEEIGVATLTMAKLQERMLALPEIHLRAQPRWPGNHEKAERMQTHYQQMKKTLSRNWPEIRKEIQSISLPGAFLLKVLQAAGASASPEALGWGRGEYARAAAAARHSRDRFTFLDLHSIAIRRSAAEA